MKLEVELYFSTDGDKARIAEIGQVYVGFIEPWEEKGVDVTKQSRGELPKVNEGKDEFLQRLSVENDNLTYLGKKKLETNTWGRRGFYLSG